MAAVLYNGNGVGLHMIDEENDEMERLTAGPALRHTNESTARARRILLSLAVVLVFFVASATHLILRIGGKGINHNGKDYRQKQPVSSTSDASMETLMMADENALSDSQEHENDTTLEISTPLETTDQQGQKQQQVSSDSNSQNDDTPAEPHQVVKNGTTTADNDSNTMTQIQANNGAVYNTTAAHNDDAPVEPQVAAVNNDTTTTTIKNAPDNNRIQVLANNGVSYNVTEQTALQIENYKRGTGLMLNIHITHHAGTSMCGSLGHATNQSTPNFACMKETNAPNSTNYTFPASWRRNETSTQIALARQSYHFLSWEYTFAPKIPLSETEWENPNLLSMIVMRDPMTRLLAGDGWVKRHYPNVHAGNASHEEWWEFANSSYTDNYALRILAGNGCCQGAATNETHLETAKALIQRLSIVLDISCLSQGMEAVGTLVNITIPPSRGSGGRKHASARERIGYDDVYEYLLEKNRLDIELYEWSKQLALVNCTQVALDAAADADSTMHRSWLQ